ncbi:Lipocalin-like domain-containing protein [Flavobacterium segetis]|uniref:Lipocalin-like domain-containing protein n=1 Tax=Flavobacterium segetis TaxID=271157 RepID=A0A1M5E0J3_9FLAO|nr:lipocalin family protein [Flavobacterium segetis]SHF72571.1 Lipocalin-like domain-containing protein [Flavobacterium segetis]
MKNLKKNFSAVFLTICVLSGFLFTSCDKEETEANLIVKNWTLESKTVLGASVITDCEKGSTWNFKTGGKYEIKDCQDTKTGTWRIADDGKTLTLDDVKAYKVVEKSFSNLVIELQAGDLGLVRWTFK